MISTVLVAPITSTVRGLPSEVPLDVEDGLKGPCAVNLDHGQTVRKEDLQRHIVTLRPARMAEICRALSVATGCSQADQNSRPSMNWIHQIDEKPVSGSSAAVSARKKRKSRPSGSKPKNQRW